MTDVRALILVDKPTAGIEDTIVCGKRNITITTPTVPHRLTQRCRQSLSVQPGVYPYFHIRQSAMDIGGRNMVPGQRRMKQNGFAESQFIAACLVDNNLIPLNCHSRRHAQRLRESFRNDLCKGFSRHIFNHRAQHIIIGGGIAKLRTRRKQQILVAQLLCHSAPRHRVFQPSQC